MITKVNNTISTLKNLWVEMFLNKTNKVSNISDGSVLNAVAFGTAKVAQKAIKDIAIVEAQIFPMSATGEYLDKSAALFGVSPRKQALGSSTYVRVYAQPGTQYPVGTIFIAKNGVRFTVDQEYTVDNSGYGYVSVRSTITGIVSNVEANSITQVSPRPLTHIECTNEYAAIGGRDYEDDETFRTRILNYNNKLSEETVESWTQKFQDLNSNILKVMNVGLGEDGKIHIYLVTQNGSFFTDDELQTLLEQSAPFFGLTEINLSGESVGIVLENAKWMIVGGEVGMDFRVELQPDYDIATVRKNIQVALTKYLDFRFWDAGRSVQWDDLLQIVKNSEGVKYVPDEYFSPYYDQEVPLNMLPRIKGFRMRDLEGNILYDAGSTLSNIFYPAEETNIYQGVQNAILAQKYLASFAVTNAAGIAVANVYITIGNKIIVTDAAGIANIQLENGEYEYSVSKAGWDEQTGEFIVLNSPVYINVENFTATPYNVNFIVLNGSAGLEGATITIGTTTLETDSEGKASLKLEPNTYEYTIEKSGFKSINSIFTVENQDLEVVERMFLTSLNVNFSVIDRKRNVYVPQANLIISDYSLVTDNEGQANAELKAGTYPVQIYKDGYERYSNTIDITNEDPNCVLLEMTPVPYGVKFTVTDDLNNVIPLASIEINGQILLTDNSGVVTAFLQNGTYSYRVYKVGYNEKRGSVTISNNNVSENVQLTEASYALRFVVRDIETGDYIQGAEISVANVVLITNINGVTQTTVKYGTYDYVIKTQNYKEYRGTVEIINQDVIETVYLELRDSRITFTVTDEGTGEPVSGIHISLINKGTHNVVSSGLTNPIGEVVLQGEAAAYTWEATNQYYYTKTGEITLEKLKDEEISIVMTRKPVKATITVKENIPGFSGDETEITSNGNTSSIEVIGEDGYNYIAVFNNTLTAPKTKTTFDMGDFVTTYRKNQETGVTEPYDFDTNETVYWNLFVTGSEAARASQFVTVVGHQVTIEASTEDFRQALLTIVVNAQNNSSANQITLLQQRKDKYNHVKSGLKITVTNTKDKSVQTLTTNANGQVQPTVTTGIEYTVKVGTSGFYQGDGTTSVVWDYEPQLTDLNIICSKTITAKIVQKNTGIPLIRTTMVVKNMSIDCSYTTPDTRTGQVTIYVSPISLAYTLTCQYHVTQNDTFTPTAAQTTLDLIMDYYPCTIKGNIMCSEPYSHPANDMVINLVLYVGPSIYASKLNYYETDKDGLVEFTIIDKNGKSFNLPPINNIPGDITGIHYNLNINGLVSNYEAFARWDYYPIPGENVYNFPTVKRKKITMTGTVKEILPRINATAANPVKAGMKLISYYPNGTVAENLTTNANGQITRTLYAGLEERFAVNPITFYEGDGVKVLQHYTTKSGPTTFTKDLVYTNSKYVICTVTSDVYGGNGEMAGATYKFEGLSVVQSGTLNNNGQVEVYLSPIPITYTFTKQYYNNYTGTFTPTGNETSLSYIMTAKLYNVKVNVSISSHSDRKPNNVGFTCTNLRKDTIIFKGITDANGQFTLQDVPYGTYDFLVGAGAGTTREHLYYLQIGYDRAIPVNDDETGNTPVKITIQYAILPVRLNVKEFNLPYSDATITIKNNIYSTANDFTLDTNGYVELQGVIRNMSYTASLKNYANYYSNSSFVKKWINAGGYVQIENWNLVNTQDVVFVFENSFTHEKLSGVSVSYNGQTGTSNAQGQVTLKRSGVVRTLSATLTDYSSVSMQISPATASPITIPMQEGNQIVRLSAEENLGGAIMGFISGQTINYTNTDGDSGTLTLTSNGMVEFNAKMNKEYTFTFSSAQMAFYAETSWKHTYTAKNELYTITATCNKTVKVIVKDEDEVALEGLYLSYAAQHNKQTNAAGEVSFYYSSRIVALGFVRSGTDTSNALDFNSKNQDIVPNVSVTSINFQLTRKNITMNITAWEHPSTLTSASKIPFANSALTVNGVKMNTDANGKINNITVKAGKRNTYVQATGNNFYQNPSISNLVHYAQGATQSDNLSYVANHTTVGTLKDSEIDSGIAGATVKVFGQTLTSNAQGQVTIVMGGRTYPVEVTATDYIKLDNNLSSMHSNGFTWYLAPVTSSTTIDVKEKLFGLLGSRVVEFVQAEGVSVVMTNADYPSITFSGTTNAQGIVTFGPMRKGTYNIKLSGSNWTTSESNVTMPSASISRTIFRQTIKGQDATFAFTVPNQFETNGTTLKKFYPTQNPSTSYGLSNPNVTFSYKGIADTQDFIYLQAGGVFNKINFSSVTMNKGVQYLYSINAGLYFNSVTNLSLLTTAMVVLISAKLARSITVQTAGGAKLPNISITVTNMFGTNNASGNMVVTTNTSGVATVYVTGQNATYTINDSEYETVTWTDNLSTAKTVTLTPMGTKVTGKVVRIDNPLLVCGGCIVKFSKNDSTIERSTTTDASGNINVSLPEGTYYWETGGSTTVWGGTATGNFPRPYRSIGTFTVTSTATNLGTIYAYYGSENELWVKPTQMMLGWNNANNYSYYAGVAVDTTVNNSAGAILFENIYMTGTNLKSNVMVVALGKSDNYAKQTVVWGNAVPNPRPLPTQKIGTYNLISSVDTISYGIIVQFSPMRKSSLIIEEGKKLYKIIAVRFARYGGTTDYTQEVNSLLFTKFDAYAQDAITIKEYKPTASQRVSGHYNEKRTKYIDCYVKIKNQEYIDSNLKEFITAYPVSRTNKSEMNFNEVRVNLDTNKNVVSVGTSKTIQMIVNGAGYVQTFRPSSAHNFALCLMSNYETSTQVANLYTLYMISVTGGVSTALSIEAKPFSYLYTVKNNAYMTNLMGPNVWNIVSSYEDEVDALDYWLFFCPPTLSSNNNRVSGKGLWSIYFPYGMTDASNKDWNGSYVVNPTNASVITDDLVDKYVVNVVQNIGGSKIIVFYNESGNTYQTYKVSSTSNTVDTMTITGYSCFYYDSYKKQWIKKTNATNADFWTNLQRSDSDYNQPALINHCGFMTDPNTTILTFIQRTKSFDINSYAYTFR